MAQARFDVIIVGQGLAGTTLAWFLLEAGKRVLVIDASLPVTSSKIAAGLITPITGQRMTLDPSYAEYLSAARAFYARIEKRTGRKFFFERTAVRLFQSDVERENWAKRSLRPLYQDHLVKSEAEPLLPSSLGDGGGGGFEMASAQLDVAGFLEASRAAFEFVAMPLDWKQDVTFDPEGVCVSGYRCACLISCEGYGVTRNPYFSDVRFKAAKGDILRVRFERSMPRKSFHRGIWVAPTCETNVFRVGSTYDWVNLEEVPCAAARAEIERKLKAFISVPYTVLDHRAAVRPIISESKALVGLHRDLERLGFFNGLGSKGSLLGPWFGQRFCDFLVHQSPLPEAIDFREKF